jgi:hypothetical protein
MLRRSKECVINVPTLDLIEEVVGIGNSSGARIDKFKEFGLTPVPGVVVRAPAIQECDDPLPRPGVFMVAGRTINRRRKFKPQNL